MRVRGWSCYWSSSRRALRAPLPPAPTRVWAVGGRNSLHETLPLQLAHTDNAPLGDDRGEHWSDSGVYGWLIGGVRAPAVMYVADDNARDPCIPIITARSQLHPGDTKASR